MAEKSTYKSYFSEILKEDNTLYIYNYNFFYLCLAITHNTSCLGKLGINLSQKKLLKYENLVRERSNPYLRLLLRKYYSCLSAYLTENTDKTDLESCHMMKELGKFATDIYTESMSKIAR